MPQTTKQLVARLQARLSQIDKEIAALQGEKSLIKGGLTGTAPAMRTAKAPARKKKGKADSNSPQAIAQYGRRYKQAKIKGNKEDVAKYRGKLNKTALGKKKLAELDK